MTGAKKSLCTRNPSQCPGGLRALTTQEHTQPRKALHTGAWDRGERSRPLPAYAGNVVREDKNLMLLSEPNSFTASFPGAAHGPARPLCPLAPSRPCKLSCCQTPASCLALTSSSHHHRGPANTSPWMVAAETGRGQIYFLIFITSLPYSTAVFAEPEH